jgi:hypothetical protein
VIWCYLQASGGKIEVSFEIKNGRKIQYLDINHCLMICCLAESAADRLAWLRWFRASTEEEYKKLLESGHVLKL